MKKIKSKAILKAKMDVTFEIGRSQKTIGDVLNLEKGKTIKLDDCIKDVIKMCVNGSEYAKGKAMRKDGELYIRITEIEHKENK